MMCASTQNAFAAREKQFLVGAANFLPLGLEEQFAKAIRKTESTVQLLIPIRAQAYIHTSTHSHNNTTQRHTNKQTHTDIQTHKRTQTKRNHTTQQQNRTLTKKPQHITT